MHDYTNIADYEHKKFSVSLRLSTHESGEEGGIFTVSINYGRMYNLLYVQYMHVSKNDDLLNV